MGYDSTDRYQHAKLTAKQYNKLKLDLLCAYDLHRQALKELLDIVQPITRQRIEQIQHWQSPSAIFGNVMSELLDSERDNRYKHIPNLHSDLHELVMVMSNDEDDSILVMEDYWSVSHVTDEKFNKCWPRRNGKTERLEIHSQSTGIWEFDDENHTINLRIAADWQGDQWGLDNNMTRLFRRFIEAVDKNDEWTETTGAAYFTFYDEGFTRITDVFGNPENPDPMQYSEEDWEDTKKCLKLNRISRQAKDEAAMASELEDQKPF